MTQAKSISTLLFCCFWSVALWGQINPILVFGDSRFHQLQPLYADTAFIQGNTQTREIAYEYDAWGRPLRYREMSRDSVQNQFQKRLGEFFHAPNRLVFINTVENSGAINYTSKERSTIDSLPGGSDVDSVLNESWNGSQWVNNQVISYTYFAPGKQQELISKQWDFAQSAWRNDYSDRYEYDGQGNQIQLLILRWNDFANDWSIQLEHKFKYNAANLMTTRVWRSFQSGVAVNVDSTSYIYDTAGRVDSIWHFNWLPEPFNRWAASGYVTLDDTPEQQITQNGNQYRLNAQYQWYLDKKNTYIPGPKVFTDQYAETLVQTFNPNTGQLEDRERVLVNYTILPDKTVRGELKRGGFQNGTWEQSSQVTAWMRQSKSVGASEPHLLDLPTCGLPNPLSTDQALSLPEMPNQAVVEIYSMDGRQAFRSTSSNMAHSPVSLKPAAMYWVVVRQGANLVCAQKVVTH